MMDGPSVQPRRAGWVELSADLAVPVGMAFRELYDHSSKDGSLSVLRDDS